MKEHIQMNDKITPLPAQSKRPQLRFLNKVMTLALALIFVWGWGETIAQTYEVDFKVNTDPVLTNTVTYTTGTAAWSQAWDVSGQSGFFNTPGGVGTWSSTSNTEAGQIIVRRFKLDGSNDASATSPTPLRVGQRVVIRVSGDETNRAGIETGGRIGFTLRSGGRFDGSTAVARIEDNSRFRYEFLGGQGSSRFVSGNTTDGIRTFSQFRDGFTYEFELLSDSEFTFNVVGATPVFNIEPLAGSGDISHISLYNLGPNMDGLFTELAVIDMAAIILTANSSETKTVSGVISNNGTTPNNVLKNGSGTVVLEAINTYTGTTTVSGGTLRVLGNLASSAITVQNNATLAFGSEGIPGAGIMNETPITANAITVQSGAELIVEEGFDLQATSIVVESGGVLRVNGKLTTGGNVTVRSGGFLLNSGIVDGNVTFERQITSPTFADPRPTGHWVALSSPVANTRIGSPGPTEANPNTLPTNPEALLSSVWTQGFPGSDDPAAAGSGSNVFIVNNGAYAVPSGDPAAVLPVGKGMLAFLFENRVRDTETPVFNGGTATFSTRGIVNDNGAQFNFPLEGEGTWNLLGNPFAASLDWHALGASNLNGFAYLLNPATQAYVAIQPDQDPLTDENLIDGSTFAETRFIAPFQAFWVKVDDDQTGSLTAPVSARGVQNPQGNANLFNTNPTPVFSLRLTADDMQSTTAFRFGEGFSTSFAYTDAYFLSGLTTTFAFTYSLKDETPTMINSLPLDLAEAISFPIAAGAYVEGNAFTGEATFTWPSFENMPADWSVTLTDTYTGSVIDLRDASSYSFAMQAPMGLMSAIETSRDLQHEGTPVMNPMFTGERFILTIDPEVPTSAPIAGELPREVSLSQNYPNPFNPTTLIRFELPASEEVRLEVFNVQGQRVATLVNGTVQAGVHNVNFDASSLSSGVYLYRLQAGNQVLTRKMTLIK